MQRAEDHRLEAKKGGEWSSIHMRLLLLSRKRGPGSQFGEAPPEAGKGETCWAEANRAYGGGGGGGGGMNPDGPGALESGRTLEELIPQPRRATRNFHSVPSLLLSSEPWLLVRWRASDLTTGLCLYENSKFCLDLYD